MLISPLLFRRDLRSMSDVTLITSNFFHFKYFLMIFCCNLESNFACGSILLLKKCVENNWKELEAFCYRSEESPPKKYTADIPASQTNPHMIGFTEACQYYLSSVTFRGHICTCADAASALPSCLGGRKITGMIVIIDDMNILEAQLPTPKSLEERSSVVERPNLCHTAVISRRHGMTDLL